MASVHVAWMEAWTKHAIIEGSEAILSSQRGRQGQTQDRAVDLIVLGFQHKRFSDTTVIGTTTVRVTRHAPCPVLTVIRK